MGGESPISGDGYLIIRRTSGNQETVKSSDKLKVGKVTIKNRAFCKQNASFADTIFTVQ